MSSQSSEKLAKNLIDDAKKTLKLNELNRKIAGNEARENINNARFCLALNKIVEQNINRIERSVV